MKTAAWITGAFLTLLSACGPMADSVPMARLVSGVIPAVGDSAPAAPAAPQGEALSREVIEAQPVDLLRVSIIDFETTDVLVQVGANGGRNTWMNAEGVSLTFQDGLLIGSRGFGDDLMGADVSGAIAALGRGGNHTRTLDFLNGLGQIERVSFACSTVRVRADTIVIFERSHATTVIEETCTGAEQTFKNTYWRDAAGVIWQSRQWISPNVGFMGYQRL